MNLTQYIDKGISRQEYLKIIKDRLHLLETGDDPQNFAQHYQINIKRTERLDKTFELSDDQINQLSKKQNNFSLIVITEGWCGDASQVEPIVAKMMSQLNVNVNYLFRDENLDLIDAYLTNGGRSIPIFIGVNQQGKEIFKYGPRPKPCDVYLQRFKNDPENYTKDQFIIDIQKWYNQDKGNTIFEEFINLLK